jgi:hypothetical protein
MIYSVQTFQLPIYEVPVPPRACQYVHPAGQHQRLLRPHHRLYERLSQRQIRRLQLWGKSIRTAEEISQTDYTVDVFLRLKSLCCQWKGTEAKFLDVIGTKVLEFSSLLLRVTSTNGDYSPSPLPEQK